MNILFTCIVGQLGLSGLGISINCFPFFLFVLVIALYSYFHFYFTILLPLTNWEVLNKCNKIPVDTILGLPSFTICHCTCQSLNNKLVYFIFHCRQEFLKSWNTFFYSAIFNVLIKYKLHAINMYACSNNILSVTLLSNGLLKITTKTQSNYILLGWVLN